MLSTTENAVIMMRPPEVFQDDGFLPGLDLDIMTTRRPEYNDEGWRHKLATEIKKCDIWKILPTFLVSNAFSLSITVLTGCSLAYLEHSSTTDDDYSPSILFGLWSFTDPDDDDTTTLMWNRQCRPYDFYSSSSSSSSSSIFELDTKFRTARAFGALGVCIGFLTMAALWMGVIRDFESTTNWRRWVGGSLLLCCFCEAMTILILQSEVCIKHHCQLGRGGNWVVAACVLYFSAGVLLLKWPRAVRDYTHSSLAADESEEHNHVYPAEVAAEDDVWSGFWRGLGTEEVEMVGGVQPYRDNPDEEETNTGATRPSMPQQSSSLRNMLSSFDSELMVSFEPLAIPENNTNGAAGAANNKHIVEVLPPPPVQESPTNAMERLRQQSTIHAAPVQVKAEEAPPARTQQDVGCSRDSLKNILDAFDDDTL